MGNVEVAYTQIYSICIILSLQHNLVPRAPQSWYVCFSADNWSWENT